MAKKYQSTNGKIGSQGNSFSGLPIMRSGIKPTDYDRRGRLAPRPPAAPAAQQGSQITPSSYDRYGRLTNRKFRAPGDPTGPVVRTSPGNPVNRPTSGIRPGDYAGDGTLNPVVPGPRVSDILNAVSRVPRGVMSRLNTQELGVPNLADVNSAIGGLGAGAFPKESPFKQALARDFYGSQISAPGMREAMQAIGGVPQQAGGMEMAMSDTAKALGLGGAPQSPQASRPYSQTFDDIRRDVIGYGEQQAQPQVEPQLGTAPMPQQQVPTQPMSKQEMLMSIIRQRDAARKAGELGASGIEGDPFGEIRQVAQRDPIYEQLKRTVAGERRQQELNSRMASLQNDPVNQREAMKAAQRRNRLASRGQGVDPMLAAISQDPRAAAMFAAAKIEAASREGDRRYGLESQGRQNEFLGQQGEAERDLKRLTQQVDISGRKDLAGIGIQGERDIQGDRLASMAEQAEAERINQQKLQGNQLTSEERMQQNQILAGERAQERQNTLALTIEELRDKQVREGLNLQERQMLTNAELQLEQITAQREANAQDFESDIFEAASNRDVAVAGIKSRDANAAGDRDVAMAGIQSRERIESENRDIQFKIAKLENKARMGSISNEERRDLMNYQARLRENETNLARVEAQREVGLDENRVKEKENELAAAIGLRDSVSEEYNEGKGSWGPVAGTLEKLGEMLGVDLGGKQSIPNYIREIEDPKRQAAAYEAWKRGQGSTSLDSRANEDIRLATGNDLATTANPNPNTWWQWLTGTRDGLAKQAAGGSESEADLARAAKAAAWSDVYKNAAVMGPGMVAGGAFAPLLAANAVRRSAIPTVASSNARRLLANAIFPGASSARFAAGATGDVGRFVNSMRKTLGL